jgi:hypothetical protein
MKAKLINIADAVSVSLPNELSPDEEAALVAQYKSERSLDALEADYDDLDKQIANGVPAEQLLKELQDDLQAE